MLIITNLLSNAIKFTESGFISIDAAIEEQSSSLPGFLVKISVSDSGYGISDEKKQTLFDPFGELGKNDRRGIDGTNLGLAISQRLTKLMDGKIGVESTPGKGSTFWFTFKAERIPEISHLKEKVHH